MCIFIYSCIPDCLTRGNEIQFERMDCLIRGNELSNSRERIAIRENELSNSRERIINPWERIAQFDITIYLWLFLKIPMSLQGFRTRGYEDCKHCHKNILPENAGYSFKIIKKNSSTVTIFIPARGLREVTERSQSDYCVWKLKKDLKITINN